MSLKDIIGKALSQWMKGTGKESDIVLGSRVRLRPCRPTRRRGDAHGGLVGHAVGIKAPQGTAHGVPHQSSTSARQAQSACAAAADSQSRDANRGQAKIADHPSKPLMP